MLALRIKTESVSELVGFYNAICARLYHLEAPAGTPRPLPIVNQFACCLYGTRYADDFNQAKAIVALETCNVVAA